MSRTSAAASWLAIAIAALWTSPSRAADTIETFDPGLSDVELYTGFEGLGLDRAEQSAFAEGLLGYGVTPSMSLYVVPSFSADGYLTNPSPALEVGGFGTALDTAHVDVDVGLGVGADAEAFAYSPCFELNLDLEPDLMLAGLYLRGGLDVFGMVNENDQSATTLGANGAAGAYLTFAARHQLLLEFDASWFADPDPDAPSTEVGGLHLGCNVQLLDSLELIHDVGVDIPQSGEDWSAGFFVGMIATIP